MQLYQSSVRQFIDDSLLGRLSEKLSESFQNTHGYSPGPSEFNSWQNSLRAIAGVLHHGQFKDQGILLEYQLPLSSKRLDLMITGCDEDGCHNAVVIELKQWSEVEDSNIDDCVTTFVGGRLRDQAHPSTQVRQYTEYLRDSVDVFDSGRVSIGGCAFLHNLQLDRSSSLSASKHAATVSDYPFFTADQSDDLIEFLRHKVGQSDGLIGLGLVTESRYRASRKLLEHTYEMINGRSEYILLDEQLVAFNTVLAHAKSGFHDRQKVTVLVNGGPGTGKSLIAINLIAKLNELGYNAQHATGSRAFTGNIRKAVGSRAGAQFRYFNGYGTAERNAIDVLVMDEAHRIRENSFSRWTPKAKRTDKSQVDELLEAAKVSVFLLDDQQVVRPGEVGSSDLIRKAAIDHDAKLIDIELDGQFRCGGSAAFVNWVENRLGMGTDDEVCWDSNDQFDFRIVDSVQELQRLIEERHSEGHTARLTAGFCWKWSDPNADGTLVSDVKIGNWSMPWNAKPDAGRLAPNIPKADYWASDPHGINQVGCIYTAQGFEYDYCGVIFGTDLRWEEATSHWAGDPSVSHDTVVKRSKERFEALVANVYRVLLTRGLKGCYVYFQDEATRKHFERRILTRTPGVV